MKSFLKSTHHIAIICSDYKKSKHFYTHLLGFEVIRENYREERNSFKLDLALNGQYIIELFSFPAPPKRATNPESTGLRHIAFSVENINETISHLTQNGILTEPLRTDPFTGKRFTFFKDPDNLPIEIYEI